jgi:arylsulfatase A
MGIGRREFVRGAAAAWAGGRAVAQTQLKRRPNILLILSDDQGYGDLSLHGNPHLQTPVLDQLARESTEFTRFHVSPVCAPTRASLLTGRYHPRCGVHGVTGGRETLPTSETTIARALRESGYHTALYGKWHLGSHYPHVPHAMGFDDFIGFRTGHWIDNWDPQLERNGRPWPLKGYMTEALTDEALRFLDERHDPFFLYLAYNVPHTPYQVPERYWERYRRLALRDAVKASYALTACLDDNIGRVLAKLRELKIEDETIVIFLSDNGPNGARFNCGLRGAKGSVYEGGTRVPFFVRWPGRVIAGRQVDQVAAHIDLYPTLLELARVPQPDGAPPIDGRTLGPLLTLPNPRWQDRPLYFHAEPPADPSELFPGAVRTHRFNLVNGSELYDTGADPGEQENAAAKYPDWAQYLRTAYEAWFRSVLPRGGFRRLPVAVGYAEENPVLLAPPEGYPHVGLRYRGGAGYAHDWFVNWSAPGDFAHWDLEVANGGRFEVSLRYLCPAGRLGARIEVRAGAASTTAEVRDATPMDPLPARDIVPRSETYRMHWNTLPAGTLDLPRGPARLEVRLLSGPAGLEVNEVVLRRIG